MKNCVLDIESTSLNPINGRIICIGIKDVDSQETKVFSDDDEKILLESFLSYYSRKEYDTVIGYNILGFDLQFIFIRCLKNNVPANVFLFSKCVDLMRILQSYKNGCGNGKWEKLETWLQFLVNGGKMNLPYSVKELYKRGMITEIINYNKMDVEQTYELWKRVNRVLWNGKC